MIELDYFGSARKNEAVFRNILRDLNANREIRPAKNSIPKHIETEAPLEAILEKYSTGPGFTIIDFGREEDNAGIVYQKNFDNPFDGGASIIYKVNPDYSVVFLNASAEINK
jgi:hypothetical protein